METYMRKRNEFKITCAIVMNFLVVGKGVGVGYTLWTYGRGGGGADWLY